MIPRGTAFANSRSGHIKQEEFNMNCPKCGTPNPDGTQFCSVCGTPLAAAPQQQPQQYAQPQQFAQPQYQQPPQQPYGQPQYQQPYGGQPQYAPRPRAPFQWYDAKLPLVQRINRPALEIITAYFFCMFTAVVFNGNGHAGWNIFDMGALGGNTGLPIGPGGFIAMWIIDIIVLLGLVAVETFGIHLGTVIGGGVLFATSLMTMIFAAVDSNRMSSTIGIGAIFMLLLSISLTTLGVFDFLKFRKKLKTGR